MCDDTPMFSPVVLLVTVSSHSFGPMILAFDLRLELVGIYFLACRLIIRCIFAVVEWWWSIGNAGLR